MIAKRTAFALTGLALLAGTASAAPPLGVRDARVGATDVPTSAAFYEKVFGMTEVQRYDRPGQLEIILGFGTTLAAAKANSSPRIVVITPPAGHGVDVGATSPLVLNVPDLEAAVAKVVANGGSIERSANKSATSGNVIAMIKDPAGNRIELIKEP